MITRHLPSTIALWMLLIAAGCGGSGDDTPPATGAQITIAGGGTVTSDDGKLQLIVGANSANAEGTATITKATPPAEVLADPSYVPDSTYAYNGPDLEFSPPANWEFASARALASGPSQRESALATSRNDIDVEQMCQASYAQSRGQAARAVWVSGDNCPATCTKQRGANTGTRTARAFCAPDSALRLVPMAQACPTGKIDASAEPAWAAWAADNGMRVCEPPPTLGAALLGSSPITATTSCATQDGSYVCKPASVKSGSLGVWFPQPEPPNSAATGFYTFQESAITQAPSGNGYLVSMLAGGSGYDLKFKPRGNAENLLPDYWGLWGVALFELIGFYAPPNGVFPMFERKFIWQSPSNDPSNIFQGLCCDTPAYVAPEFVIVPFSASGGPAVRYFQAEAYGVGGDTRRSSVLRVERAFAFAPTISSFTATPNVLPIGGGGGSTLLAWVVNGATTVNILPSLGNVGVSNGSAFAVVTDTTVFTLTATNSFGQTSTANVVVVVAQDITPPAVTLAATAASVIVPAHVTLTANASDAIGVAKVEFYRGATLIATDTTAPYLHGVSFSAADVGPVTFTARAYDAAGNAATSTPVVVSVTDPPGNGDTYASPTGVDSGNASCAQATPCLTIAKAASLAQPNKTVWLLNGEYKIATQPVPINIPASLTLRAVNPGLAGVGQGIVLQGSATVVGIVIRRNGFFVGDQGYIQASSGTVVLDGVRVIGSASSANSGATAAIALSGTAQATMTPGNIADYADQLSPIGQGAAAYATLNGSARLTVNGGLFGGAALGGSADLYPKTGAFTLSGSSRLDLNNTTVNVDSYGVVMNGGATQLFMTSSTLHANANSGFGAGIHAIAGTPHITLVASGISGFVASSNRGISVGPVGNVSQPGVAATVSLSSASVAGNDFGIWVSDGTTPSSLTLNGSNTTVSTNTFGGIVCVAECNIDIGGGEISGNGTQNPALVGGFTFYGGVWLGSPAKNYFLKLRNVQVVDNKSLLGGNSNQPGNSGITMSGSASSGYDLGNSLSPGGNIFGGNTTGSETSGLNVGVAPGLTVRAVGNTFIAGTQGANAQGKYQVGTAPCGPSSCDVTSTGSGGANFRITSGVLRLAE